ncbi:MAG: PD-(D/E)XK nuclease domain-containing protein, partial [Bacteroidales bacterium]|nr:PD-(D/E)XK nuclease domain-containing protein [Bacteroidales bacterium]
GDVESGKAETFLNRLKAMLAGNDYKIAGDKELYFQNTVYVIFRIMGFYIEVERDISDGRIDFVLKVPGYIYIIEFKLDGSAEEAIKQIEEKDYAAPYAFAGKKIIKVGVNFSSETRNITDWKIKEQKI